MTDTDTEKAEQKKSAIQEYTVATARLSEHVRFIAFGILAIVYALYTSDSAIAGRIVEAHPIKLGVATVAALVAILLDYAQYFASDAECLRRRRCNLGRELFELPRFRIGIQLEATRDGCGVCSAALDRHFHTYSASS